MPEIDTDSPGAFESFLRWIGRPGYAVRNVLKGNFEGALRNIADIPLEAIDAALPGDLIPEISRKEDYPEFSDVIGGMEPGIGKTALDIAGGIATDPLTYLSLGATAGTKAAAAAAKAAQASAIGATRAAAAAEAATKATQATHALQQADVFAEATPELSQWAMAASKAPTAAASTAGAQAGADFTKQSFNEAAASELRNLTKSGTKAQRSATVARIPEILEKAGGDADVLKSLVAAEPGFTQGGIRVRVPGLNRLTELPEASFFEGRNLDPLSNLLGVVGKEASAVGNLGRAIVGPETADKVGGALKGIKESMRKGLGWDDLSQYERQVLQQAEGKGGMASRAAMKEAGSISQLIGGDPQLSSLASDVAQGIHKTEAGYIPLAGDAAWKPMMTAADRDAFVESNLASHPEVQALDPEVQSKVREAARRALELGQTEFKTGVEGGVLKSVKDLDPATQAPLYVQRSYELEDVTEPTASAGASALKARKFSTRPSEYAQELNESGMTPKSDLIGALASRAQQQGRLIKSADLGRKLIGKDFVMAEPADRQAMTSMLDNIKDTDFGQRLASAMKGTEARGNVATLLATASKPFKAAAVYGAIIPRIGSIVRNRISMPFQAGSTPGAQSGAKYLANPVQFAKDLSGAVADGMSSVGIKLPKGQLAGEYESIDAALTASRGDPGEAVKWIAANVKDPQSAADITDAMRLGVVDDGYVTSEGILKSVADAAPGSKVRKALTSGKFRTMWDMPGVMFQGVEKRGRYGLFKELKRQGMSAEDAAAAVKEGLLDYTVSSAENRLARDMFPFMQFMSQSIKQQAQFLSRTPAAAVGFGQVIGQPTTGPIYPYMQGKTNLPLGTDEQGNPVYATSLGLPVEALSAVPNLSGDLSEIFRDLRTNVASQSQPLLKTVASGVSGRDFYFDTPFGSYDKAPEFLQALGVPERGEAGRLYNMASATGLIQPLETLTSPIDVALSEKQTPLQKLLSQTSGLRVTSVDEARALQQLLEQQLKTNPQVQQYTTLYDKSNDPTTKAMLGELKRTKSEIRKRKKEAQRELTKQTHSVP